MVTNEKQDKVEQNLLRYIKKSLGLLVGDDDQIYDILDFINKDDSFKLFGRIMFGSDKVPKGYSETQLTKIIKQYGGKKLYDTYFLGKYSEKDGIEKFAIVLNNYIIAWEKQTGVDFANPEDKTITKISGLRYILTVFHDISFQLINQSKQLTTDNYTQVISQFPKALDLESTLSVFGDDPNEPEERRLQRKLSFNSESGTTTLAKHDVSAVLAYSSSGAGYQVI